MVRIEAEEKAKAEVGMRIAAEARAKSEEVARIAADSEAKVMSNLARLAAEGDANAKAKEASMLEDEAKAKPRLRKKLDYLLMLW
jgi:fused signal recognition particle receptor